MKFMYCLKFHGARTAFGRVNVDKMTLAGHRTILFKLYDSNGDRPCPAGHRTMSDIRQGRSNFSLPRQRTIFYESDFHRWEATCLQKTYCIYINISLLKTKNKIQKKDFSPERLMVINMQRTIANDFFAFLRKCGFHLNHCQSKPHFNLFNNLFVCWKNDGKLLDKFSHHCTWKSV